jgi:hypothetical protein
VLQLKFFFSYSFSITDVIVEASCYTVPSNIAEAGYLWHSVFLAPIWPVDYLLLVSQGWQEAGKFGRGAIDT